MWNVERIFADRYTAILIKILVTRTKQNVDRQIRLTPRKFYPRVSGISFFSTQHRHIWIVKLYSPVIPIERLNFNYLERMQSVCKSRKFGKECERSWKKFNLLEILEKILFRFKIFARGLLMHPIWANLIRRHQLKRACSVDLCFPNNENILLPTVGKRSNIRDTTNRKSIVYNRTIISREIFFYHFEEVKSNLLKILFSFFFSFLIYEQVVRKRKKKWWKFWR